MTLYNEISFPEPRLIEGGTVMQFGAFEAALLGVCEQLEQHERKDIVMAYGLLGQSLFGLRTGIGIGENAEDIANTAKELEEYIGTYPVREFSNAIVMLNEAVEAYSA